MTLEDIRIVNKNTANNTTATLVRKFNLPSELIGDSTKEPLDIHIKDDNLYINRETPNVNARARLEDILCVDKNTANNTTAAIIEKIDTPDPEPGSLTGDGTFLYGLGSYAYRIPIETSRIFTGNIQAVQGGEIFHIGVGATVNVYDAGTADATTAQSIRTHTLNGLGAGSNTRIRVTEDNIYVLKNLPNRILTYVRNNTPSSSMDVASTLSIQAEMSYGHLRLLMVGSIF